MKPSWASAGEPVKRPAGSASAQTAAGTILKMVTGVDRNYSGRRALPRFRPALVEPAKRDLSAGGVSQAAFGPDAAGEHRVGAVERRPTDEPAHALAVDRGVAGLRVHDRAFRPGQAKRVGARGVG